MARSFGSRRQAFRAWQSAFNCDSYKIIVAQQTSQIVQLLVSFIDQVFRIFPSHFDQLQVLCVWMEVLNMSSSIYASSNICVRLILTFNHVLLTGVSLTQLLAFCLQTIEFVLLQTELFLQVGQQCYITRKQKKNAAQDKTHWNWKLTHLFFLIGNQTTLPLYITATAIDRMLIPQRLGCKANFHIYCFTVRCMFSQTVQQA